MQKDKELFDSMRNIVILNSLHFSYPLPILMRVSYNTLIVKQNTSDYYKYSKNPVPRTFCCRLRLFGLYLPRNFKRQIMRIKTFEIRVDPAFREHDERTVNEFLSAVRVPRLHCGCLRSRSAWMLLVIFNEETADEPAMRAALVGRHLPAGAELTPGECERFEALRVWRDRRAAEMGCKPFVVASNRDLLNVARSGAASPADLLSIAGFGSRRAERYGEEIAAVLGSVAEADFD